jgi:hypothetical protein
MAKRKPAPQQPTPKDSAEYVALQLRLKELDGSKLNRQERAALDLWQRTERANLLANLPKGVYCDLAGRQHKVIDDFAERYELPLRGATVDLGLVIKTLHTRVSELAALARPYADEDEAELARTKMREEIRKLERQSEKLRIEIQSQLKELVSRHEVKQRLEWLSGKLRGFGNQLHRIAGADAQLALNQFLEDLAVEMSANGEVSL